ncbi:MAG: MATE family efflux transporter, partial [Myxococcota bacterium]|nr:MATE family efflux transporter [Myxococcota bacterium]
VGRLGPNAQAAVGYAQQLFFVAQSALFALSFAGVALMSRAIGAGEPGEARRALAASLVVAVGVSVVLFVALASWPVGLLRLLSAEEAVIAQCVPYMRLVMGSSILMAIALTIESSFRSDRDTVTPMLVTAVLTVVKIGLNGVFIFGWLGGPVLGVTGAGLATLVAQGVAVVIFVALTLRRDPEAPTALRPRDFRGLGSLYPRLIRIALPGVGERLVMNAAMVTYFAFIGSYGTVAAAAYTIGIRILSFSWIPGTGYSQAVATLVGQSLGAGDEAQAERSGRRAAQLAIGTAIAMGALGILLREPLARLFTVDGETVLALSPFMLCLSLAQPAMQLHFTLAGAFRGAGDTMTPLYSAIVGNWVFRVPLALLCAWVLELPLVWLWMVLILDHLSRAIWLAIAFRRGTWKRRSLG